MGRLNKVLGFVLPVGRFLRAQWQLPAGVERALWIEWRLVVVRWFGVALVSPGIPFAGLSFERSAAACGVLLAAAAMNSGYRYLILNPQSALAPLLHKGLSSIGDFGLHIVMIAIGGGLSSPFYYVAFTITISYALRYGYVASLAAVLLVVALDSLEHVTSASPIMADFVLRSSFLFLSVLMAGYLREQAARAEKALEERLAGANRLNEASARLGATLEFSPLLQAIVGAGAHLFRSERAVLEFGGGADHPAEELMVIGHPEQADASNLADLVAICEKYRSERSLLASGGRPLAVHTLPSGAQAAAVTFAFPTRLGAWATLVCELPSPVTSLPDPDLLHSFVERVSLAMENSTLYQSLSTQGADLQQAYADLATAHQELLQLDEMKDSFLANVSHELRTPLTSIRSFSELLLSYDNDPEVQREFLQIINTESERLSRMVGNILDVLKIEAGFMEWNMAVMDPMTLLKDLGRTFRPLVGEQQLVFKLVAPASLPPIYGDRDRLYQVLSNLVYNAMKFTQHGRITLSAAAVDGEVRISVADTGVGIAEEDIERVFDRFQQVEPTLTGKPRGSGLGLAICREIITHHEGRIWVESEPGKGSTFSFALNVPLEYRVAPGAEDVARLRLVDEPRRSKIASA